jgi:hypothetical protein
VYPSEETTSLNDAKKDYFTAELKKIETDVFLYVNAANGGKLLPYTDQQKKCGYLNRDFEIVIPAVYEETKAFSEGLAWVWMD